MIAHLAFLFATVPEQCHGEDLSPLMRQKWKEGQVGELQQKTMEPSDGRRYGTVTKTVPGLGALGAIQSPKIASKALGCS
jgi:hypothetical protein